MVKSPSFRLLGRKMRCEIVANNAVVNEYGENTCIYHYNMKKEHGYLFQKRNSKVLPTPFSCGAYHTVFISQNQQPLISGAISQFLPKDLPGRLKINQSVPHPLVFADTVPVKSRRIIQSSSGMSHCVFINSEFEVLGLGGNQTHELGMLHIAAGRYRKIELNTYFRANRIKISEVTTGYNFSAFKTTSGEVFGSGKNFSSMFPTPMYVVEGVNIIGKATLPKSEVVVRMASGHGHLILLTKEGHVYAPGKKINVDYEGGPKGCRINFKDELIDAVSAGYSNSFFFSRRNKIYMNENARMIAKEYTKEFRKGLVELKDEVSRNVVGIFSCKFASYFFLIDNDASTRGVGDFSHGQLGEIGKEANRYHPKVLPDLLGQVQFMSMCGSSTTALLESGEVWVSGFNTDGRLGNGKQVHIKRFEHNKVAPKLQKMVYSLDLKARKERVTFMVETLAIFKVAVIFIQVEQ